MGMSTLRHRSWKPPLQATEQGDHLVHFLSLQLRSHEPVLHARDSWTVLHFLPPFFGFVTMLRVRPWTPPSQSLEHLPNLDHFDITQSTGHFIWLHFLLRDRMGHLMPNSFAATMIVRVNVCVPPQKYGFSLPLLSFFVPHLSSQGTEQSPGM
jgi:hypothetical protein